MEYDLIEHRGWFSMHTPGTKDDPEIVAQIIESIDKVADLMEEPS